MELTGSIYELVELFANWPLDLILPKLDILTYYRIEIEQKVVSV